VSYDIIKKSSKASSFELLIKNITLIEKVEDFYKELDQITGYRFNCHGKPDPDIYFMKDIIKIRLMELEILQTRRIKELIKNDLNEDL
jgi:chaperonin GroEL (HSP60 family)